MTKAEAQALGYTLERIAIGDGRHHYRSRYFWLTPKGRRLGPHDSEAAALQWLTDALNQWAADPPGTPHVPQGEIRE